MEIISPPEFIEEQVTDVDIAYIGGAFDTLTLRPEELYEVGKQWITVTFVKPPETIHIHKRNVLSYRTRVRTVKRPVSPEQSADTAKT